MLRRGKSPLGIKHRERRRSAAKLQLMGFVGGLGGIVACGLCALFALEVVNMDVQRALRFAKSLEDDTVEMDEGHHDPDGLQLWHIDGRHQHIAAVSGDQREFYRAVGKAIRGEAPNPVPAPQALAVMAVIAAGLRASAEGKAMPLSLTDEERAACTKAFSGA